MDRFIWCDGSLEHSESKLCKHDTVGVYDGESKTSYDHGDLTLTTHRLLWRDSVNIKIVISLSLELIVSAEKRDGGLGRSPKIILKLKPCPPNKAPGPIARSQFDYCRLSFKSGGESEFFAALNKALQDRVWLRNTLPSTMPLSSPSGGTQSSQQRKMRASGIVGIERKMEENYRKTDQNISLAFEDLTKLMDKAKEMVALSTSIAAKIKDKKGDITDDETVKFKSYLLSLGIPNPVTKETHGSGTHYHMQLAREIATSLRDEVDASGGIMLLVDAYCRVNRARGMELLSPEDLLNACKILANLNLPLKLRQFDSGVLVLQSHAHSDEVVIKQTVQLVEESGSLSADGLANLLDVSVLLAKERLLLAESCAKLCRDHSDEGLQFFPNRFLARVS